MKSRQPNTISRRGFVKAVTGAATVALTGGPSMAQAILRKPIPKTGERLPVIVLGTWQTFDVSASEAARAPLKTVLQEFVRAGGSVIDSSPMYGSSESVTGDLAQQLNL